MQEMLFTRNFIAMKKVILYQSSSETDLVT